MKQRRRFPNRRRQHKLQKQQQQASSAEALFQLAIIVALFTFCEISSLSFVFNGCVMATKALWDNIMDFEFLSYFMFAAIFVPAVFLFVYRRAAFKRKAPPNTEEPKQVTDTAAGDKQPSPRKYRKKSYKKKKNRGSNISVQANEQLAPEKMESQPKAEDPEKHRARRKYRKNTTEAPSGQQNRPVKFYETLPLFEKLQLDQPELYNHLLQYCLYPKQLEENGFPLECPDDPGKVIFGGAYKYAVNLQNPNQRHCSRCSEKFTVSDDGLYEADTDCYYHSGKRLSVGGVSGAGAYSCCGSFHSLGCTTGKCHVSGQVALTNTTFVKTREKRQSNQTDCVYALDCEMCYTVQGLEVTRISVVGTDGLTVYDSYVLPENPVIDYNTAYSGITANDLKDVKTTLADVQVFLLKLLNARTILIGHGLENDLRALHLIHKTIVDTSVVFPHTYGLPYKRSLKTLASSYLGQTIQQGEGGHDSVEDARACMELLLFKIEADSHSQSPVLQNNMIGLPFNLSPMPPQWAMSAFTSPNFAPCHFNYFVPPVGSPCALC